MYQAHHGHTAAHESGEPGGSSITHHCLSTVSAWRETGVDALSAQSRFCNDNLVESSHDRFYDSRVQVCRSVFRCQCTNGVNDVRRSVQDTCCRIAALLLEFGGDFINECPTLSAKGSGDTPRTAASVQDSMGTRLRVMSTASLRASSVSYAHNLYRSYGHDALNFPNR